MDDFDMIQRMRRELREQDQPPKKEADPVAAKQEARVERGPSAEEMIERMRRRQATEAPVMEPPPERPPLREPEPEVLPRPPRRERVLREPDEPVFRQESAPILPDEDEPQQVYGELRQALVDAQAGGWIRYSVDETRGMWLMVSGVLGFVNSAATSTLGGRGLFHLAFRDASEILGWMVGVAVAVAITIGQLVNANWYDEDGKFLADRYRKHRAWLIPDTVFGVYYWLVPSFLLVSTILLLGGHVADVFPIVQPRDIPLLVNYALHQGGVFALVVVVSLFLSVTISVFLNVYGSDLPERALLGPRLPDLARQIGYEIQEATFGQLFPHRERAKGQAREEVTK